MGPVRAGEKDDAEAVRTGEGRFADIILLGVDAVMGRDGVFEACVSAMMERRSTLDMSALVQIVRDEKTYRPDSTVRDFQGT